MTELEREREQADFWAIAFSYLIGSLIYAMGERRAKLFEENALLYATEKVKGDE